MFINHLRAENNKPDARIFSPNKSAIFSRNTTIKKNGTKNEM